MPLRMGERFGKGGAQEVGSAGRADQQRAAGADNMASGLFIVLTVRELDQVGEVVSRMARRRDGSDLEPPGSNGVAIVEGAELLGERYRFACRDRVPGARRSRERQRPAQRSAQRRVGKECRSRW